jgi:uncharacterized protein
MEKIMEKEKNKVIQFIILTFVLSWGLIAIYYFSGGRLNQPQALTFLTFFMFGPMVATITLQKLVYKEPVRKTFDISSKFNRWFLVAWLLPFVIAIATFGVTLLFPGIKFTPDMAGIFEKYKNVLTPAQIIQMKKQMTSLPIHPYWLTLLQGLIAGISINAVFAFGEELGWRGFLPKQLLSLGFYKTSLIIGIVWGVWHAPIIIQGYNYPEHPLLGVFLMIIWCILLTPIFLFVRLKAKSVIAAAIIHGSINASFGLTILLIKGGNDLTTGLTGFPGMIVLLLVNLGLYFYQRKSSLLHLND